MKPPYAEMQAAVERARELAPDADKLVPLWCPSSESEILVEVWHGGRAKVVGV